MSVALEPRAAIRIELRGRRSARRRRPWSEVAAEIEAFARGPGEPHLSRLVRVQASPGELLLQLHPAEEPVIFTPEGRDVLKVSAATSAAGPGYHVYLVEWLDRLAEHLGFTWQAEAPHGGDPTGYRTHRDLARLQRLHATRLAALARHLRDDVLPEQRQDPKGSALCVGLPPLAAIPTGVPGKVASVTGLWDPAFVEALAKADADERLELAARFLPWWQPARDARFWEGVGRVLAVTEVGWHVPPDARERGLYQIVLDAFARARALDPGRALPEAELQELTGLLAPGAAVAPPRPEGLGFRRGPVRMPLPGGWQVHLPGYFYDGVDGKGEGMVFWFQDRTVRLVTVGFGGAGTRPRTAEELVTMVPMAPESVWHVGPGHLGRAAVRHHAATRDRPAHFRLEGRMAVEDNLCEVTVYFAQEADRPWAEDLWRSLEHGTVAPDGLWHRTQPRRRSATRPRLVATRSPPKGGQR